MVSYSDLKNKTMTPEKKAGAKNDYFAFYIGRPISYILTIPFLILDVKPNTISFISLFPSIIGFFLIVFNDSLEMRLWGWFGFLLWNFMDGIDGNIARYTNQCSKKGILWDATGGYVALTLSFPAMGYIAFQETGNFFYLMMGCFSSIFCLFARLIMHKNMLLFGVNDTNSMNKKTDIGALRIFALNVTSAAGFYQVFMLIAILFNQCFLFTGVYFLGNLLILLYTGYRLLR